MIWLKLIWRDVRFNAVLWLLSLIGIAVGVAGWVGMEAATGRAGDAFDRSIRGTFGEATHIVEHPTGKLSESTYVRLAREYGIDMTPIVEEHGRISSGDTSSKKSGYVRLLGIDPLSYGQLQSGFGQSNLPFASFLAGRSVAVLSPDFRDTVDTGDTIVVAVESRDVRLRVGGFLKNQSVRETVYTDVGWLQKHVIGTSRLSRILLKVDGELPGSLRSTVGEEALILPTGPRTRSVRSMVSAFQWNLRALSFLSLFVGGFLVYSTMFLYTSRQVNVISLLKTMGVANRSIAVMLFGALGVMGVIGSVVGVLLGSLLSMPLGELVRRTVDQLYVPLFAQSDVLDPWHFAGGMGLGLMMSLVGGAIPVLGKLGISPRAWDQGELVSDDTGDFVVKLFVVGLLCWPLALATVVMVSHVLAGFLACFLIAFGGSLMSPYCLRLMASGLSGVSDGQWLRLAARNVRFYGRRTGVMIAVLVAAFSMVLAVSVMVDSFRTSVDQWIRNVVKADYYVRSVPGSSNRDKPPLSERFIQRLKQMDGVTRVGLLAEKTILMPDGSPLTLRGIQPDVLRDQLDYQFNERTGDPWEALDRGQVWLSEPGAYRMSRSAGDALSLPGGGERVTIAAIYNDYSTRWAVAYMDLDRMKERFEGVGPSSAAVFTDGQSLDAPLGRLVRDQGYYLQSQQTLKKRAMERFDRTFAVTDVMKIVSALVAGIGLLILVTSFARARSVELGRLAAMGASRFQKIRMLIYESLLVGLGGFLVSVPTGLLLSYVLIDVINRRSFGWLIPFTLGPRPFVTLMGLIGGSVALAVVFPLYQLFRVPLESLLREES